MSFSGRHFLKTFFIRLGVLSDKFCKSFFLHQAGGIFIDNKVAADSSIIFRTIFAMTQQGAYNYNLWYNLHVSWWATYYTDLSNLRAKKEAPVIHFLLYYWYGVIKQVTEFDIFLLVRLFCCLPVHAGGGEGSSLLEFNRASLNWSTVNFLTRSNLIFEHSLLVVGRAPPNYALKHFEFEAHNSLTKGT